MLNNLGLSYFENSYYVLAEDHFTQAITNAETAKDKSEENNENLSFYYKNRGLANYHLGKVEEAERDYDVAIRLNPHNADNYFNRGNVWLSKYYPEFERAHQDFDHAIQLEGDNAKLYHAKGLAFQAQAEYMSITEKNYDVQRDEELVNLAIIYFSKALDYCDTFISSMFHLGLMYRRTNRFHDALYQFSKVQE